MSPGDHSLPRAARTSRIARNGVATLLGLLALYLAVVGFASIPHQIFFPDAIPPTDCASDIKETAHEIARVATGGAHFSFEDKLKTQARLEGLRNQCADQSKDVKRLMRAHEHAWNLEERRQAFFKRFKLASHDNNPDTASRAKDDP